VPIQVLQLARAKVNDGTIIAFVQNSSGGFSLSADQIIYLKQQGISDAILNAMLTQPKNGAASTATCPHRQLKPRPSQPPRDGGLCSQPDDVLLLPAALPNYPYSTMFAMAGVSVAGADTVAVLAAPFFGWVNIALRMASEIPCCFR